ncbi:SERINE/ARGININE REPETITIVE MATRIX-LIKE PROTEIN [Salix koriyanagi]|uniref:SERINE/ARGININE REPETITIVE MATRIX-LIKE PROTEIN n=1 Tax=Salix koriyanagi TaxID=2511006 RepID=A0A9Q0UWV9_9ROSI|nr:SERINE/ARGININE REPETITIVE MATRIX-LIKE PROTEIN [Salix koriyanagi]
MGSPQRISIKEPQVILNMDSSTRRRRRTVTCSNSPEFEFWMVRNPSFPQPNLVSADELFVDGVLLPLHLLHQPSSSSSHPDPDSPEPEPEPEPEPPNAQPDSGPEISPASITAEPNSSSKRWKDIIFKKGDKKTSSAAKKQEEKDKDKDKKREKRSQMGASSAELNIINIWPFSRSRSAGNSVTRPKLFPGAPGTRKVSSAPCSRSNSAGESKSRKSWPSSPSRPGVHLGRSSPVWQARRGGSSGMKSGFPEPVVRSGEKLSSKKEVTEAGRGKKIANGNGSTRAKVLNVNVPACIGYRNQLSCRSGENSAIGVRGSGNGGRGRVKTVAGGSTDGTSATNSTVNVGNGGNLFNFRSLFTKKVY